MPTKPYADADVLRSLYVDEGLTTYEVADELGCSQSTVVRHLSKHGIERPKPWRDADTLRDLYWSHGLTIQEVADELGVSKEPVARSMRELGVPRRKPSSERPPTFYTNASGYEEWKHEDGGDRFGVYVHRLLAVAEYGFDAVADHVIHHTNGVPWDNRPSNIEIMTKECHDAHHLKGGN